MQLLDLCARRQRKYLRCLMRGYILLKSQGGSGIAVMRALRLRMVDVPIPCVSVLAKKNLFGNSYLQAELVVRQFLLQMYNGRKLYAAMLYSKGNGNSPIRHPMPKVWRDMLDAEGFPINHLWCAIAWNLIVLMRYGHGVLSIGKIFFRSVLTSLSSPPDVPLAHVYFVELTRGNLPTLQTSETSYDICSWYASWQQRRTDISAIGHNIANIESIRAGALLVSYIPEPTRSIYGWTKIFKFIVWSTEAILGGLVDMLQGRWWSGLLLAEAAKAAVVRLQDAQWLAKDYLFHFSGTIYKPMWAYEAEAKSSRAICYFYSTSEQPKLVSGYESQRFEWGPANWRTFIVWDEYQEQVLRRDLPYPFEVLKAGSISFSDSNVDIAPIPNNCVAVFDIQPHRKSNAFGVTTMAQYWASNPDVYKRFLIDTHAAIKICGGIMLLKAKRDIGQRADKGYVAITKALENSGNMLVIPPDIAAPRMLQHCKAAISVPFTSTALYFKDQGFPSAYYDPTSWIQKDDKGAHGIPILSGPNELQAWLRNILIVDNSSSDSDRNYQCLND